MTIRTNKESLGWLDIHAEELDFEMPGRTHGETNMSVEHFFQKIEEAKQDFIKRHPEATNIKVGLRIIEGGWFKGTIVLDMYRRETVAEYCSRMDYHRRVRELAEKRKVAGRKAAETRKRTLVKKRYDQYLKLKSEFEKEQ